MRAGLGLFLVRRLVFWRCAIGRISHADLLARIHYDPDTGVFTRIISARGAPKGVTLGSVNGNGYVHTNILGRIYLLHQLAYFYMTGEWAEKVDHADRDKTNQRWNNLRKCTQSQNVMNTVRKPPKSGVRGVNQERDGKYRAAIYHQRKKYNLGRFATLEEAAAAYDKKARELFGEFYLTD